jgi:hypothetical protein
MNGAWSHPDEKNINRMSEFSADLQLSAAIISISICRWLLRRYYNATVLWMLRYFAEEIAIFTTERQSRRCSARGPQYVPDDKRRIQRRNQRRIWIRRDRSFSRRGGDDSGIPDDSEIPSMTLESPTLEFPMTSNPGNPWWLWNPQSPHVQRRNGRWPEEAYQRDPKSGHHGSGRSITIEWRR